MHYSCLLDLRGQTVCGQSWHLLGIYLKQILHLNYRHMKRFISKTTLCSQMKIKPSDFNLKPNSCSESSRAVEWRCHEVALLAFSD